MPTQRSTRPVANDQPANTDSDQRVNQELLSRVVALEDFVLRSTALIGEILRTPKGQGYSTEQLVQYRDLMGDMESYSHVVDSESNVESVQQPPVLVL